MLKIKTISSLKLQKVVFAVTLILSIFSFSGSAFFSTHFHQTPHQSELLYSTQRKRRSVIFSFSGFLRTKSCFSPNQFVLEKVMQSLYSQLCKIQFHVLTSQHFLKEIDHKLISLKTPSQHSEDPNLNFSLG